jgi:hypothetical protein
MGQPTNEPTIITWSLIFHPTQVVKYVSCLVEKRLYEPASACEIPILFRFRYINALEFYSSRSLPRLELKVSELKVDEH